MPFETVVGRANIGISSQRRNAKKEVSLGRKKELVREYTAQGLVRDKALNICRISKNQYYYEPTGGKRGCPKSKTTNQLVDGVLVEHSNRFVKDYIKKIFENPQIDYGYHKITSFMQLEGFYINHKKVYRLMKEERILRPKRESEPKNYVQYRIVCPESPLRLMEMDIKQVWVQGLRRNAYILTIIDVFTRVALYWTCGLEMRQAQVQRAWEMIIETYLQLLGIQAWNVDIEVRSDNGPQFCATQLQEFLKENYLMQTFTHPYTPQENGHIESFHAILGVDLQGKSFQNLENLDNSLNKFYEFYNFERIHGSTVSLPPVTFWKEWHLGNIERKVLDSSKRKVKFKLSNERQSITKVLIPLDKREKAVFTPEFLICNDPDAKQLVSPVDD